MRPFGKSVFVTSVETGCVQSLWLYPGTGEHTGAVCGAQKVSEDFVRKANRGADLMNEEEIAKASM